MINIKLLQNKKYNDVKLKNNIISPKVGDLISLKYVSLDKDLLYKYKLNGVCTAIKKNGLLTSCSLALNMFNIKVNFTFYIYSPFIIYLKIYNNQIKTKKRKSKQYNLEVPVNLEKELN
jgi:ribosomal protein L19